MSVFTTPSKKRRKGVKTLNFSSDLKAWFCCEMCFVTIMLLFNTQRSNPCRVSLSVKHISMWCYRRLSCSWPWCLYSLAGLLTRTVVVKHEPETVCLQGKSWAFWNVLVTAVRHNFLLWRRVLCFSSSRHISHSFIAARLVFSLWVIWESLSVCVFLYTNWVAPAVTPARGYKHGAVHDQLKWQLYQGESSGCKLVNKLFFLAKIPNNICGQPSKSWDLPVFLVLRVYLSLLILIRFS